MSSLTLGGAHVHLRALEPEDLDFLYLIENDESLWHVSHTQVPYSKFVLRQYLQNAHQDIFEARQLRLAICAGDDFPAIGLIDLYDFDPQHHRAGVGIVVSENAREQGYASEALELLINYCFTHLQLHQLYSNIDPTNEPSVALFTKFGFERIGVKKDWNISGGQFCDEAMYQLINRK